MTEPILVIEGENASIDPTDPSPDRRPNGALTCSGRTYEISIDGEPGWHQYPRLSPAVPTEGKRSICFDMFACNDNENLPHRAEVALVNVLEKVHPLAFGIRRFVGLSFFIHNQSEVPRNWTAIFQVWQFYARHSPPFELRLRMGDQGDPYTLLFQVRNDGEQDHVFFERDVLKDKWYRLVFEFLPAYVGAEFGGEISVWLSGANDPISEIPTARYEGFWGYAHEPTTRGQLPILPADGAYDLFEIRFGVYRRKQERRLKIFFNNIVYADSFATAARADWKSR